MFHQPPTKGKIMGTETQCSICFGSDFMEIEGKRYDYGYDDQGNKKPLPFIHDPICSCPEFNTPMESYESIAAEYEDEEPARIGTMVVTGTVPETHGMVPTITEFGDLDI